MLTIYKASAGSGKTFTLTVEYLILALESPQSFGRILAVTFTNKAAQEMKERVLLALNSIDKQGTSSPFAKPIIENSKYITEENIVHKARKLKKLILHDYSYFSISTIDSFVQKVVRSFEAELRMWQSYTLELNSDVIINHLLDMLYAEIDNEPELERWLVAMTLDAINNDKGYRLDSKLKEIAQYLFNEKFLEYQRLSGCDKHDIEEIMVQLNQIIEQTELELDKLRKIISNEIDLIQGQKRLIGAIRTLLKGEKNEIVPTIQKFLDGKGKDKAEDLHRELTEYCNLLFSPDYQTAKIVKENIYTFGLFTDLMKLLEKYKKEEQVWHISETQTLLRELIKDVEDAPIVYEKIGQRLKNIMIDEFQDTSRYQWYNFKPLIENSIAEGNKSLIVGDVKQAIYRWRNGDWTLLLDGVKKQINQVVEKNLSKNWRSHKRIVEFNNDFFVNIIPFFNAKVEELHSQINLTAEEIDYFKELIPRAYDKSSTVQQPDEKKPEGLVEVVKSNDYGTVADLILESVEQGFDYSDIAILVRGSTSFSKVIDEILAYNAEHPQQEIPFITDKSLNLGSSSSVSLIMFVLRNLAIYKKQGFSQQEMNYVLRYIAYKYTVFHNENEPRPSKFFEDENFKDYLPKDTEDIFETLSKLTLYEQVQYIISHFELTKQCKEIPFIRTFEDSVLNFVYKEGSLLDKFIDFWDTDLAKSSISAPDTSNAVKIMTIHKSKGLAFPVVILITDWQLKQKNSYFLAHAEAEPFEKFGYIPIKSNKDIKLTHFAKDYIEEEINILLDNLNLLYVAMTRPIAKLSVFYKQNLRSDNIAFYVDKVISSGSILKRVDDNRFVYGELPPLKPKKAQTNLFTIENYTVNDWQKVAKVATQTSLNALIINKKTEHGTLLHQLLSEVEYEKDFEAKVKQYLKQGLLSKKDADQIRLRFKELMKNEVVRDWFSERWTVYNEKPLLSRNGKTLRPDRVILDDKQVIVIDFKFGKHSSKYIKQVRTYMQQIAEIEQDKQIKGYLLYIEQGTFKEVFLQEETNS